jgi:hypothetical protein
MKHCVIKGLLAADNLREHTINTLANKALSKTPPLPSDV